MNHDPLCMWSNNATPDPLPGYDCGECDLIAKVREDQTERCLAAMAAVEGGYSVPLGMSVGMFIDAMRHEFCVAVRALKEKP